MSLMDGVSPPKGASRIEKDFSSALPAVATIAAEKDEPEAIVPVEEEARKATGRRGSSLQSIKEG